MLQIGEEERPSSCELHAELFSDLASKGVDEPFSRLYSATRKSPLTRIDAAIARHLAKQYRTVVVPKDRDDDDASGNI